MVDDARTGPQRQDIPQTQGANNDRGATISIWIPISFGATGFFIGFVAGLSSSPVVKELLPLIFGVIAGGGGFFAKVHEQQSRIIGISLAALAVMASAGIVQGIVIRDASSWHDFWLGKTSPREAIIGDADRQDDLKRYITLLDLQRNLKQSGLNVPEQQRVIDLALRSSDLSVIEDASRKISENGSRPRLFDTIPALAQTEVLPATTIDRVMREQISNTHKDGE
jgi:hypothetical protein